MPRSFRNTESYEEEQKTRNELQSFLLRCGFVEVSEERKEVGKAVIQTVRTKDKRGSQAVMAVRLCWRKRFGESDQGYAAFQLLFKVKDGGPEKWITQKLDREREKGKTHWLVVKRDEVGITDAVMIPIDEVLPMWLRQREIYAQLIRDGKLGSRSSNPAINGASPALYVQDDRAPEAVAFILEHPSVLHLVLLPGDELVEDDTLDDLPRPNFESFGSDGGPRFTRMVSGVKRDARVRREVIVRACGRCEYCGANRPYGGFLDVHHIFGVETSDRVWNCVALCPNCHRDCHFSPEQEAMNDRLLGLAARYGGAPRQSHAGDESKSHEGDPGT